jgi:hypothetical protein
MTDVKSSTGSGGGGGGGGFWDQPADAKSSTKDAIAKVFDSAKCGSLIKTLAPVTIDSSMSVMQASALLAEKHISSAPYVIAA